jgi:hypothetical protein
MLRQIGAPPVHADALARASRQRLAHRLELRVDADGREPGPRQRHRVTSAAHRDVQRAPMAAPLARDPLDPFDDEGGR